MLSASRLPQAKELPYPEYPAYLSRVWRADERTRTADLFITSALLTREGADAPLLLIVSRWRTRQRDRFPLNSRQFYSPDTVICEHGTKPNFLCVCILATIWLLGTPQGERFYVRLSN